MNYGCPDVCSGFERSGGGGGRLSGCEICDVTMKLVVLIKLLPIRLLQNQIIVVSRVANLFIYVEYGG